MFICRQKINFIFTVFLEMLQIYCKIVMLGTLGKPGSAHLKWYYHLAETFCISLQAKNQLHLLCFFWIYCKDTQTSYFGYFGHVWLRIPKLIKSTCRKLRCFPACWCFSYYILKNPAIWLANIISALYTIRFQQKIQIFKKTVFYVYTCKI